MTEQKTIEQINKENKKAFATLQELIDLIKKQIEKGGNTNE